MNINVFGLGYVGCVSAACLAQSGNRVIGIDIDETKVKLIEQGRSPVIEPRLEDMIRSVVAGDQLRAVSDIQDVDNEADVSFVSVGTPSNNNGSPNLNNLVAVSEQIGEYIGRISKYHVVDIRSTVLPGTNEDIVIPIIEKHSGKSTGSGFGLCMNPEFLREGTSISDYYNPPFHLVGEFDQRSGDVISSLYRNIDAPIIRTSIKEAEMVKYVSNAFHAVKVCFANEIGNFCKQLNIDSYKVMNIFCRDKKLNISSSYLNPGYAFGGSCLPKDLRAMLYEMKKMDLVTPLLSSVLQSNTNQIENAYGLIKATGFKRIGILGLSFKSSTDDLRESPMVELVEKLIGKGYQVLAYDREVSMAKIVGTNKQYIERSIPHISKLLRTSIERVVDQSEVIVVANKEKEYESVLGKVSRNKCVIDLAKIKLDFKKLGGNYEGICW